MATTIQLNEGEKLSADDWTVDWRIPMEKPFIVAVFSEGEFEHLKGLDSEAEAEAFALGVATGADLYGAGSIGVYVLPAELAELEKTEKSDAVAEFRRFYAGDP